MPDNMFIHPIVVLTILMLALPFAGNAAELPPLTHRLTALDKPVPAPPLRLKNMDEDVVDIADLKGRVVVVNFWATWCPPCRREMASLERLHLASKEKNVTIIAVNVGEDVDTVFSFMGSIEPLPSFTVLFDRQATAMADWKVKGLPTTYIVNPAGSIVYRAIGGREFDHPDIQQTIMQLGR